MSLPVPRAPRNRLLPTSRSDRCSAQSDIQSPPSRVVVGGPCGSAALMRTPVASQSPLAQRAAIISPRCADSRRTDHARPRRMALRHGMPRRPVRTPAAGRRTLSRMRGKAVWLSPQPEGPSLACYASPSYRARAVLVHRPRIPVGCGPGRHAAAWAAWRAAWAASPCDPRRAAGSP